MACQLLMLFIVSLWLAAPFSNAVAQQAAPPVIYYSDLDSGPNTGGENSGGVYVTVYGNNFGSSQGSSLISIGNTAAVTYKLWSNTKVAFQVPASAAVGAQLLSITVNGIQSNAVPFTIRTSGTIYCVSTSGNDTGPGTFAGGCWKTVQHAVDKMTAGDTTYVRQGVVEVSPNNEGSVQIGLNAWNNGTAGNPIALGGYPGETATVGATGSGICNQGQSQCYEGLHAVGGINQNYSYWTIFNLTLRGQQFALEVDAFSLSATNPASTNWRVVGNDFSCPWMNGASGPYCATFSQTNYVWFYGNNVHDVQTYPYSQAPGPEWNGGVYFTTDSNHIWCAWNTVSNVQGARGIQFHSSPLGNGGAGDPTGHNQYDLHVHDNRVHDIAMDGILFATVDPSQGRVEAYNNIVYNAGKGPQRDGSGYYSGIYVMGLTNSGPVGSGDLEVYNNTLYNNGAWTTQVGLGWGGGLAVNAPQNGSPDLRMHARNNIVYQPTAGEFYWTISNPSSECSATCGNLYGSNNLFYGLGAPIFNPGISSSLNVDPQFVNLAGLDFHLTAGSPAANGGTSVPLAVDDDGVQLPEGSGMPIGAYAYGVGSVPPVISVSINPGMASLQAGESKQFVATVTGASNSGVVWRMNSNIGALSQTGVYTAPSTITSPQTITITASSTADPTKFATAIVSLVAGSLQISEVNVTSITPSSATVVWTTSDAASSAVDYGLTPSYGSSTTPDPTLLSTHGVVIGNLAPSTIYHYRVRSVNAAGQSAVSSDATFTTLAVPLQISGINLTSITSSSATVVWTTSDTASSAVDYGLTASYGFSTTLDPTLLSTHGVVIGNLAPSTIYHYRVRSVNATGQSAVSSDATFTTLAVPPPPSGLTWTIAAASGGGSQLNLSWAAPGTPTAYDYITLTSVDAPDWWSVSRQNTQGASTGNMVFNLPGRPGRYEFHYMSVGSSGSGFTSGRSAALEVGTAGFQVLVSPTRVVAGGKLSISWTAGAGTSNGDRIGLYRVGATNDTPIWDVYTNSAANGNLIHRAPSRPGFYEVRYVFSDALREAAKSNIIAMQ